MSTDVGTGAANKITIDVPSSKGARRGDAEQFSGLSPRQSKKARSTADLHQGKQLFLAVSCSVFYSSLMLFFPTFQKKTAYHFQRLQIRITSL